MFKNFKIGIHINYLLWLLILLMCFNQTSNAQVDKFQLRLDSLMKIYPKEKNDSAKAQIALNITAIKMGEAQNTGVWIEAIEWAKNALHLSTKSNFQFGIGRANINLGQCWTQKGDYAEAIKCFSAALNLSFKNGRKVLTVASSNNLARCYMKLGNYPEALNNYMRGYETLLQLNNDGPIDKQQLAAEIAQTYAKMLNGEEALNWYRKALPDNPELFYEGDVTLQIASIQMEMGRRDEALKNFRVAVQLFPARFNRKPEIDYKGLLGNWYLQFGEAQFNIGTLTIDRERDSAFHVAIAFLTKSLPLLKEGAGGKESLLKAYEWLKKVYEATNDYKSALLFSSLHNALKDSIYNKTTYLKLAELQAKYEIEKAAVTMRAEQEEEKLRNAEQIAIDKIQQEKILADERVANEKAIAEQKLEKGKALAIAAEKATYEKSIAVEKIRNEKQQANNWLIMGLILVLITSVLLFIYNRQRQLKIQAIQKAEAVHKMAELEMQSLRSQLNPHFMFNSLNSIQALILKEDSDKSQSYLANFARLLRMLLENVEKPFIPLRNEIDFLQLYLSLENLRMPDLQYSIFTDPDVNTELIFIPNMILQPYVENAIWHGLAYKERDRQLQIRINRDNGAIRYEIEDNGVGRKKAEELKSLFRKQLKSKGMELLNKRYKLLSREYNSEIETVATDVINNNEVTGTLITICVPARLSIQTLN